MGTVPHALIAAYGGDTVLATKKFAEHIDPSVNVISLVDFENDCVRTSVAVARALGNRLWGVRLDTSGTLVDASVIPQMGTFPPTGVNPQLVRNVRTALDAEGFGFVKIVASGGFNSARIGRSNATACRSTRTPSAARSSTATAPTITPPTSSRSKSAARGASATKWGVPNAPIRAPHAGLINPRGSLEAVCAAARRRRVSRGSRG